MPAATAALSPPLTGRRKSRRSRTRGPIDYEESGHGPSVVFALGSGAGGRLAAYHLVVPGPISLCHHPSGLWWHGGMAERRRHLDRACGRSPRGGDPPCPPSHLVGHSFGGSVALAVALRRSMPLASLSILEAPTAAVVRGRRARVLSRTRHLTDADFAAFAAGKGRCDRQHDRFLRRRRYLRRLAPGLRA